MRIGMLALGAVGWKIVAGVLVLVGALSVGHAVLSGHVQNATKSTSSLTILYSASPTSQVAFKVSCLAHSISGTHPNRKAICAVIAKQGTRLFAPVPANTACSMIYGGPETATITGTVNGHKINSKFSRTDGCQISRWNTANAFFTFPGYATVSGRIELSPTCPGPERPGQNCTNPSTAGTVTFARNSQKRVVAKAVAGTGFSALISTGTWTVTASETAAMRCTSSTITVPTTGEVVLSCDTGIR
jgi:hypothetical protein